MATKKISELVETTSQATTDNVVVNTADGTRKQTKGSLTSAILNDTNVGYNIDSDGNFTLTLSAK